MHRQVLLLPLTTEDSCRRGQTVERPMNDVIPYCYRVEQRTVVPGVIVGTLTGHITEKRQLYVVIEGGTERYIGNKMQRFTDFWLMRRSDFYLTRDSAELAACVQHNVSLCTSLDCGWFNNRLCWGYQ